MTTPSPTPSRAPSTESALAEVRAERERQNAKWGEQNHRSLDPRLMDRTGGCTAQRMAEEYEIPTANRARAICDVRFRHNEGSWAHILVEEVAEAIEAGVVGGEAALRDELVQVAAVAVAWIECIDRRAPNDGSGAQVDGTAVSGGEESR